MQIPILNMVEQNKITMEIEVWKNKEKWKTYSMEFQLTSHTVLLLNCEKTQPCMGHIVILSFLLFLWSVSKYKTCNWHGLSYIYFLTWSEYFFFFFSFQFSFCFLVSHLTKLIWPYWRFKIILAQITLVRFPL